MVANVGQFNPNNWPDPESLSLGDRQKLLCKLLPELLTYIYAQGYSATLGDAFRDKRVHGAYGEKASYAARKSLHKLRLAIDLNLFDSHGRYLQGTPEYAFAGQFWTSLHPLCEWGGSGERDDGNHFSVRWEGRW